MLVLILLAVFLEDTIAATGCQINCGVVNVDRNGVRLLDMVADVWGELQAGGQVDPLLVSMSFESLPMRTEMDWDTFAQAYMDLRSANVSAIIGPYAQPIVTSSERFSVPYFLSETRTARLYTPVNLVRVFPSMREMSSICTRVIQTYHWRELLVFYDSQDGADLIEDLLTLPNLRVRAKKLDFGFSKADIRAFLLEMRQVLVTNFVIIANKFWTTTILNESLYVSMLSSRHSWIIVSLDLENSDLDPFGYTEVNLTSFDLEEGDFPVITPLPHFSHFEYVSVYEALLTTYELTRIQMQNTGLCYTGSKQALVGLLQQVNTPGATGRLSFREDGSRDGYLVRVMSLSTAGLAQSGVWNSSVPAVEDRLVLKQEKPPTESSFEFPLGKQVVKVVTIEEPPFLQYKKGHTFYEGNSKFEGFCMDLLEHFADRLGFEYEVYLVPDNMFGSPDEEGNWNGVIGEIMNGNASLAVSPVTITSQREEVVDFSKPYKPRGLSLLMKKPKKGLAFFQFLDPLSPKVWALMGVALVVVSFSMYIVDKLAPPEEPARSLNPGECVWVTFASLVLNSTDILPRTIPGRILAGALWLFSLIIISTYTANLAAFLTISKFDTPINTVYDLGSQGKVKYGTVWSSATSDFFQYSQLAYFKDMWQFMAVIEPENMVNNTDEGFQKVRESNGDYAFIWDDDVIEHEVNKDCELEKVGNSFDASKGYGVAMPKGALYRDTFSMATLELGEDGILTQLEHKWWEAPVCMDETNPTGTRRKSLEINGIAGVFIVLTVGIVVALLVAFADYMRTAGLQKNNGSNSNLIEEKNNTSKHKVFSNDVTLQTPELTNYVPMTPAAPKHTNIF